MMGGNSMIISVLKSRLLRNAQNAAGLTSTVMLERSPKVLLGAEGVATGSILPSNQEPPRLVLGPKG